MRADTLFILRERHPWESIDLSVLMFRRWFGRIAPGVAAIAAATTAIILLTAGELAWIALPVLWWLKPALDRFAIVPAGVLLFSPRSKGKEIARPLLASLGLSLVADLSWRRLSPWSAYLLPSRVFEKPSVSARAGRYRDLLAESRGWIFGTAVIFELVEWAAAFSLANGVSSSLGLTSASVGSPGFLIALSISYALILCVAEPLFALSCFCLYINRRTIAEGWDLELRFKRLSARGRAAKALVLCIALCSAAAGSIPCVAQGAPALGPDTSFAQRAQKVLEDPVFGTPRTEKRLVLRKDEAEDDESEKDTRPRPDRVMGLFDRLSSEFLRVIVAAAVLGLILTAVIVNRKSIALRFSGRRAEPRPGGDGVRYGSAALGRDLADELGSARGLWERGDRRAALGLVYAAAIEHGARKRGWKLDGSSTEGDCLREARRALPGDAFAAAFERAVAAWSELAWAGSEPDEHEFEAILRGLEKGAA